MEIVELKQGGVPQVLPTQVRQADGAICLEVFKCASILPKPCQQACLVSGKPKTHGIQEEKGERKVVSCGTLTTTENCNEFLVLAIECGPKLTRKL